MSKRMNGVVLENGLMWSTDREREAGYPMRPLGGPRGV